MRRSNVSQPRRCRCCGICGNSHCRCSSCASLRGRGAACASCATSSRPDGLTQPRRQWRELLVFRAAAPKAAAPRGGERPLFDPTFPAKSDSLRPYVGSLGEPGSGHSTSLGADGSAPIQAGHWAETTAWKQTQARRLLRASIVLLPCRDPPGYRRRTPLRRPGWVGWTSWAGRISPRPGSTTSRQFAGGTADVANGVGWRVAYLPDGRMSRSFGECRPGGYLT